MENKEIHGWIYLITNLINGKQYIGQTVRTIKDRFDEHISDKKMYISRAIRKHGIENFKIEEIDVAYNQNELNLIEGVYMAWFNTLAPNGYNIKEIIDGKGKHSEKSKEKMRKIANQPERLKSASQTGKMVQGNKLGTKSKYCGINIRGKTYSSHIGYNNHRIHLGTYHTEIDAAKAYDIAAIKYFGNDAILNFPELRYDYINNKISLKKIKKQDYFKSGEKGIRFDKQRDRWQVRWFDNKSNKNKSKNFKTLEEAKLFKNLNLSQNKSS